MFFLSSFIIYNQNFNICKEFLSQIFQYWWLNFIQHWDKANRQKIEFSSSMEPDPTKENICIFTMAKLKLFVHHAHCQNWYQYHYCSNIHTDNNTAISISLIKQILIKNKSIFLLSFTQLSPNLFLTISVSVAATDIMEGLILDSILL